MRQLRYSVAASLDGYIAGPNGVTFASDAVSHVRALKQGDGKPLWLWGGGELCRELASARLLDGIDVAIIPVVLGKGLPMMATPGPQLSLKLKSPRLYKQTGTLLVEYDVISAF